MPSAAAVAAVAPYADLTGRSETEVAAELDHFAELLVRWNGTHNLVSRETLDELWTRHVSDSLQLLVLLRENDKSFVDVGSGSGFPAIPLCIGLKGRNTDHLLIESNAKKASFLRASIRELALPARVESIRAEAYDSRETPDVVTARAVAPLPLLLDFCAVLMAGRTRGLFHKGREYGQELEAAQERWRFDVVVHQSGTDPHGVVLEMTNLQRRQPVMGRRK